MTVKAAAKEIEDYFNLDLKEHGKQKLISILTSIAHVNNLDKNIDTEDFEHSNFEKNHYHAKKHNIIPSKIPNCKVNLYDELEYISSIHDLPSRLLRTSFRRMNIVKAKAHFVRYIFLKYPLYFPAWVAKFLNISHSTVHSLLYECKVDCPIAPLPSPPKRGPRFGYKRTGEFSKAF